ncbi:MAG: response regulator [bacterium]
MEDNEYLVQEMKEIVLKDYEEIFALPIKEGSYQVYALWRLEKQEREGNKIDLVILDINLDKPTEDGIKVLKAIRGKYPSKEELPVLVLTLYSELAQIPDVEKLANGILRKQRIVEKVEKMKLIVKKIMDNPLVYSPKGYAKMIDEESGSFLDIPVPSEEPGGRYIVAEEE